MGTEGKHGWSHPWCERCFASDTAVFEPLDNKVGVMTFRWPTTVKPDPDDGQPFCCSCGYPTWCGIFFRSDPDALPLCPDNKIDVTS